jgi:cell division protein ZapA|tara:strand:- start:52 stop:354 length:303 start_codon:yes stop_codon:yes gene_type:complete
MSKNTTSVKILDTEYKIACPPEESEAVKRAAVFLDIKLKEIREATNLDESKAAIITALNISNDYLKDSAKKLALSDNSEDMIQLTDDVKRHIKTISLFED